MDHTADHSALIDRILEVERSARALSDEALERQANLEQSLAEEKSAILQKHMTRSRERLEQLARSEQEKKARTLAAQDQRLAQTRRKMDRTYARYCDNWVDTLFHQVVDLT